MSFHEFSKSVNQIIDFVARVNEENIPYEIKRTIIKIYANTLKINLSDRMVDHVVGSAYVCTSNAKKAMAIM